ncbi:MAG: cofactor-independent phosphoglycerate mutase [Dehalococcoidales bacterium]|nr:cofactor-independent phosphoglycerate mutase [Dehalococcoidales bacterium]
MKYCVLIMDGSAGLPIPERGGKTSLELARTPNLDAMASAGLTGLAHNVPPGMDPDSAVACMSIFGYDPQVYYTGRAPIEAVSLGIDFAPGEVVFRCNPVTIQNGKMVSHSAGSISTEEDRRLMASLNEKLGNDKIHFYPGVSYRNILKLKDAGDTALAICTPPHDIPGKTAAEFFPRGKGSDLLRDLMSRSESVFRDHPVNKKRIARGELPATGIWLFWGSGRAALLPAFSKFYGIKAAVTSGVDLLRGLGKMAGMSNLNIPGVTDAMDNDYAGQAKGALEALKDYDIVIIHVEAPDEAGHAGSLEKKIEAIEKIDAEIVSRIRTWSQDKLRVLVMSDHPTPVKVRTHTSDPVPFLLWGNDFKHNGGKRFTETEAKNSKLIISQGFSVMGKLVGE